MKNLGKFLGTVAIVSTAFVMTACSKVPTTQSEGRKKMEDCGYSVTTLTADDVSLMFGGKIDLGAKTAMSCEKATEEQMLLVIWFNTEENAEDFKTVFKMVEDIMNAELGDLETKYEVEGEVFYFGTLQACEDFVG